MALPDGEGEGSAIRLFVDAPLEAGASVVLGRAQTHYLRHVMRRAPGDRIRLFNGRHGEWQGALETLDPRGARVRLRARLADQGPMPALWLLFAPLTAARTRFVVEKATELGVGAIHPVLTDRGRTRRANADRLRAQTIEAAEQCGRLEVPLMEDARPLAEVLTGWPPERRLLVCDPRSEAVAAEALSGAGGAPWAILVGPEGGYSPEEHRLLAGHPAVVRARFGPRILRAETAALAALACWQAFAGDWRRAPAGDTRDRACHDSPSVIETGAGCLPGRAKTS